MTRKVALALTLLLLFYWLPADLESIRYGLKHQGELALGISLKIFMHLMAIVGLARDEGFGYVFLLGASAQGLIVAVSALRAIPLSDWWLHREQLVVPVLDTAIRLYCLGFVAYSYRHFMGWDEEDQPTG